MKNIIVIEKYSFLLNLNLRNSFVFCEWIFFFFFDKRSSKFFTVSIIHNKHARRERRQQKPHTMSTWKGLTTYVMLVVVVVTYTVIRCALASGKQLVIRTRTITWATEQLWHYNNIYRRYTHTVRFTYYYTTWGKMSCIG